MKPLKLTITAFGPYLREQVIDFERLGAHGLFLIHGRTGSGKSSILDALCFALFGETTGGERDGQDMVTTLDRGAETKVVLEFEHAGSDYRVTRYPTQEVAKVRGEGLRSRQTEATLERIDSGEVVAAKARDVTASVREMLRCDVVQFRQTVVLPQGDFRRVVTDDGSRREILARIFRTERFAQLAEHLKEYAKSLAQQGRAIREQRESLLAELGAGNAADIVAKLGAAEDALSEAVTLRDVARVAKDRALEERTAGVGLAADFAALQRLEARAAELAAEGPRIRALEAVVDRATRAASLGDLRDQLDRQEAVEARLQQDLSESQEALVAARAGLVAAEADLAAWEESEGPALLNADVLFKQLDGQRENVAGLAHQQLAMEVLAADLATAEARQQDAITAVDSLQSSIQGLESEAASLAELVADSDAARSLYEAAQADLTAWNDLDRLHSAVDEIDMLIAGAQGAAAREHLEAAVRVNAPGLLAGTLNAGEPCPVCGSVHHPEPSAAEDIGALTHAFEAFGKAAAHLAGLSERRRAQLDAMAALRERRGWTDTVPPRDDLVAAAATAAARTATVDSARTRSSAIGTSLSQLRRDHEEQQSRRSSLTDEVNRLTGLIQRSQGEIAGALRALPPECRDPAAFQEQLERNRALVEELRGRLARATVARDEARVGEAQAATAARGLAGQVTSAGETLERLKQEFGERLAALGFVDTSDFELAELDPDELSSQRETLANYRQEVVEVGAGMAALGSKLAGKERPDLAVLQAALDAANERAAAAETAASGAATHRDAIRRGHERFMELEARDASVAQRRTAAVKLDQLANGQLSGRTKVKLETFVLQSIFHEVLEEGNRHLRHMTGGRYTLLLREAVGASGSGLELDVRDNSAGSDVRPVATLSGGEGFLASLALALGLSEVAQRRSGGLELGALFIDEGFGSLDAQALDQVVDILRGLQDGHRMVGVISHVEELKRRIPAQLHVLSGRGGSTVEMLLNV
ncbi:MAG TPA: SMC family ATPase [Trueperaceae bacterium]|nr:SMC family ATPase [Trueperaceae bacterium]